MINSRDSMRPIVIGVVIALAILMTAVGIVLVHGSGHPTSRAALSTTNLKLVYGAKDVAVEAKYVSLGMGDFPSGWTASQGQSPSYLATVISGTPGGQVAERTFAACMHVPISRLAYLLDIPSTHPLAYSSSPEFASPLGSSLQASSTSVVYSAIHVAAYLPLLLGSPHYGQCARPLWAMILRASVANAFKSSGSYSPRIASITIVPEASSSFPRLPKEVHAVGDITTVSLSPDAGSARGAVGTSHIEQVLLQAGGLDVSMQLSSTGGVFPGRLRDHLIQQVAYRMSREIPTIPAGSGG